MPRAIPVLGLCFVCGLLAGCEESSPRRDAGLRRDLGLADRGPEWRLPDGGYLPSPDAAPPGSDRCEGATSLSLASGTAKVNGTTVGARNEYGSGVRCGETVPLVGPQRYFRIDLTEGVRYRVELRPQFKARLYLFSSCGQSVINTDCGSGGATGASSGEIEAGKSASLYFSPHATGSYLVAVDSTASEVSGSFELSVEALPAPQNGQCAQAQALPLSAGKATVQGSTLGATNEFGRAIRCAAGGDLTGPQVYYTVDLVAGSWYRLSLAPSFAAVLFLASAAADCKPANLESDCGGRTGTVLPGVPAGGTAATAFAPMTSGTYLMAIDSIDPSAAGDFTLTIEELTPPTGMICDSATPLTWVGDSAKVSGSTSGLLNDHGVHVSCGVMAPLVGPQSYYQISLEAVAYRLVLRPDFPALLAVGRTCLGFPADCGSSGLSGTALAVAANQTGTAHFTPPEAGTYLLAVDSATSTAAGKFSLEVVRDLKPANGSCSTPRPLSLGASPAVETGGTGALSNDLVGVSCGNPQGPWDGPQAYYRVPLKAGLVYTVELQPDPTFDPALYALPASTPCSASAVSAGCSGLSSDQVGAGLKESLTVTPAVDTDYLIAVDSWSPSEVGDFTLTLSWK